MTPTALESKLGSILNDAVSRGDVPHAAAIVTSKDEIIFHGQAGPRRLGEAEPLSEDTVFWIHSMTKPLTATGVMQLVEQGRVGLDDDCGDLIPALRAPNVLEGFDGNNQSLLRPARGTITLRRLLTHTSGFVYDTWNADHRDWLAQSGLARGDYYNKPENFAPLGFDPGERWEYGIGIDWAGKVLEAITGETLDAYLQQNLFKPLGMTSTGFLLTPSIRERLSGVHQRGPDGIVRAAQFDLPDVQDPKDFTGGGQLFGSASDYARFMRMILNKGTLDGTRILSPDTVALMQQNHIGDIPVTGLPTAMPEVSNDVQLFPETDKRWGLSFMITMDDLPHRRRAGSLAWAGLRNTYFWIDPKSGLAAALFTQLLPFADPKTLSLLDRFERAVYA